MNKKLCAALFTVLVLTFSIYAQQEADFIVTLTDDGEGAIIKKYTGTAAVVRIPAAIQEMPIHEIGEEAFFNNTTITSVVIPAGVKKIVRAAFSGCLKLTSVTIPEGLESIGDSAFLNCTALSAITLPQSLKTLGVAAFRKSGITAVTIPAGITEFLLNSYDNNSAFSDCTKLRTITLSEGMKTIPGGIFWGCTALTTIALPASITRIDQNAFRDCTALTTITIPDAVEKILFASVEKSWLDDDREFQGCIKLTLASQAALRKRGYTGKF